MCVCACLREIQRNTSIIIQTISSHFHFFPPKQKASVSFELHHFIVLDGKKPKIAALWKSEIKAHHRWWASPLNLVIWLILNKSLFNSFLLENF